MTPQAIESAARAIVEAERSGVQCGLISIANPGMTLDEAYAIQDAVVAAKLASGRVRQIGWKIGLTSRAMQQALNITTPDSGVLLSDMLFDDGAQVPAGRFIQPRIEAEIAFVMGRDLAGEDVSRADVVGATEYVAPALEILDTRILRADPASGTARVIFDTVADNAANAGIVLGAARHRLSDVDLRWTGVIVKRGGTVEETGLGAGVLDDPVQGIVWLVQRLARYGAGLRTGDVVLSGSFIRPLEAPAGAEFDADFGGFGRVRIGFS
ncbi:MAG: 2-oxo-hept-4-ene-1,7-dioate hydratase [Sulfitobacter sp.]